MEVKKNHLSNHVIMQPIYQHEETSLALWALFFSTEKIKTIQVLIIDEDVFHYGLLLY